MTRASGFLLASAVLFGSFAEAATPTPVGASGVIGEPSNPSAGAAFAVRLSTDRSIYKPGQPVVLTVALQNTSAVTSAIFIRHSAHLDLRLTIVAQGKTLPPNLPFVGEAAAEREIDLLPNENFVESDPLSKWRYSLASGTYAISGEYFHDVNGVALKTNTVHITVTP